jgi:hypothetical protein
VSEQERHDKEIYQLKQMIKSELYIENRKSLIDTLAFHGGHKDIIGKLDRPSFEDACAQKVRDHILMMGPGQTL